MTYYVIEGDEIVNAIEYDGFILPEQLLAGFEHPERLRVDAHPPMAMLKRYRYWDERP